MASKNYDLFLIYSLYIGYGAYSIVWYLISKVDLATPSLIEIAIQLGIYAFFLAIGLGLFYKKSIARHLALGVSYLSIFFVSYFLISGKYGEYQFSYNGNMIHESEYLSFVVVVIAIITPLALHNYILHRKKIRGLFAKNT